MRSYISSPPGMLCGLEISFCNFYNDSAKYKDEREFNQLDDVTMCYRYLFWGNLGCLHSWKFIIWKDRKDHK